MVLGLGLVATLIAGAVHSWAPSPRRSHTTGETRLVSLSPAITETLFALGAGELMVGRSNFCKLPAEATHLPTVGTGLTPAYEPIVRLNPTRVLTEANVAGDAESLREIAPTLALPWLTLEDMVSSVRRLGAITQRNDEAERLANALESGLGQSAPETGPRVLLLMGWGGPDETTLFYVRRNSLHGRAMHAAGLRNAIEEDSLGAPTLELERLLAVDPDMILTMVPRDGLSTEERERLSSRFNGLPGLRAVRDRAVGILEGARHSSTGPSILSFVDSLRAEVRRLGTERP